MKNIFKLIFSILVCQLAGFIGSMFTSSSIDVWYKAIQKPSFNPSNWIFAPVWTLLFLMMGISLYFVLIKRKSNSTKNGLILFSIQLGLNVVWSVIFFGFRNIIFAFIEIIFLWIFIALTIYKFWFIDKRSSYLLFPYLFWVTFASILNFYIWRLNLIV